jgi:hypothetical protein
MYDIGHELLLDGKAAVKAAGGDKDLSSRRDLFSLLLKANTAADVPGKSRLSDEEVIARKSLFEFHSAILKEVQRSRHFSLLGMKLRGVFCAKDQFLAAHFAPVPLLRGHCTPSPGTNPPKKSFARNS